MCLQGEEMKSNMEGFEVGGLSDTVRPKDLYEFFSQWGKVMNVKIELSGGQVEAYVVMRFPRIENRSAARKRANEAARKWDGQTWRGHQLRVRVSRWTAWLP
jgi:hypothetical protein